MKAGKNAPAGTKSPARKRTMSQGTTSLLGSSTHFSSRSTRTCAKRRQASAAELWLDGAKQAHHDLQALLQSVHGAGRAHVLPKAEHGVQNQEPCRTTTADWDLNQRDESDAPPTMPASTQLRSTSAITITSSSM
jgi:hypothetical protein